MNSKINIGSLIKGHIKTLYNASTKKLDFSDIVTFFVLPALVAILGSFWGIFLSIDIISLLVNFGSIFTALLLSVLVLVYDQVGKVNEKLNEDKNKNDSMLKLKSSLLQDLYFNISYSMIVSLFLIMLCLVYSMGSKFILDIPWTEIELSINRLLFLPLIIFVTINLLLTILMIIKRLHSLLISKN